MSQHRRAIDRFGNLREVRAKIVSFRVMSLGVNFCPFPAFCQGRRVALVGARFCES